MWKVRSREPSKYVQIKKLYSRTRRWIISTIFEAIDQRIEMIVALKIIRAKRQDVETAKKGAKVLK